MSKVTKLRTAAAAPRPATLQLLDFNDRELLLALRDACRDSKRDGGYVTAREFAAALGMTEKSAPRCVGSRLAWMRAYGVVENQPLSADDEQRKITANGWRLSRIGENIALGRLTPPERRVLEALRDDKALEAGMEMGARYQALGYPARMMMRRALRYQMGARRI